MHMPCTDFGQLAPLFPTVGVTAAPLRGGSEPACRAVCPRSGEGGYLRAGRRGGQPSARTSPGRWDITINRHRGRNEVPSGAWRCPAHAHTRARARARAHTRTHAHTRAHTRTRTRTHAHAHAHAPCRRRRRRRRGAVRRVRAGVRPPGRARAWLCGAGRGAGAASCSILRRCGGGGPRTHSSDHQTLNPRSADPLARPRQRVWEWVRGDGRRGASHIALVGGAALPIPTKRGMWHLLAAQREALLAHCRGGAAAPPRGRHVVRPRVGAELAAACRRVGSPVRAVSILNFVTRTGVT
jgi:hypothetical protein